MRAPGRINLVRQGVEDAVAEAVLKEARVHPVEAPVIDRINKGAVIHRVLARVAEPGLLSRTLGCHQTRVPRRRGSIQGRRCVWKPGCRMNLLRVHARARRIRRRLRVTSSPNQRRGAGRCRLRQLLAWRRRASCLGRGTRAGGWRTRAISIGTRDVSIACASTGVLSRRTRAVGSTCRWRGRLRGGHRGARATHLLSVQPVHGGLDPCRRSFHWRDLGRWLLLLLVQLVPLRSQGGWHQVGRWLGKPRLRHSRLIVHTSCGRLRFWLLRRLLWRCLFHGW